MLDDTTRTHIMAMLEMDVERAKTEMDDSIERMGCAGDGQVKRYEQAYMALFKFRKEMGK